MARRSAPPAVALLADEIAAQADRDLQAALSASYLSTSASAAAATAGLCPAPTGCTCRACRPALASGSGSGSRTESHSQRAGSGHGSAWSGGTPPALRKQYRGSQRIPGAAARHTETAVQVSSGALVAPRFVLHDDAEGTPVDTGPSDAALPVMRDFGAVREELAAAVASDSELQRLVGAKAGGVLGGRRGPTASDASSLSLERSRSSFEEFSKPTDEQPALRDWQSIGAETLAAIRGESARQTLAKQRSSPPVGSRWTRAARGSARAAAASLEFQHVVDHEQWSL